MNKERIILQIDSELVPRPDMGISLGGKSCGKMSSYSLRTALMHSSMSSHHTSTTPRSNFPFIFLGHIHLLNGFLHLVHQTKEYCIFFDSSLPDCPLNNRLCTNAVDLCLQFICHSTNSLMDDWQVMDYSTSVHSHSPCITQSIMGFS